MKQLFLTILISLSVCILKANAGQDLDQPQASTALRHSLLTQQSTRLPLPGQPMGAPQAAMQAETQATTVPSGWLRKTVYAWSVGDNNLLAHQFGAALAKILPWGAVFLAILLTRYVVRTGRRSTARPGC